MTSPGVTIGDIEAARNRIAGHVLRTDMVLSRALSEHAGIAVHLKLESRQTTGSFKLRGASNALAQLGEDERRRGVVAASTGNHGRALAYAASLQGIRAVICMSCLVPENKLSEIRRLGAEVRIIGNSQDDAQVEVERLVAGDGLVMVPPFDHVDVIAGQGTIGLEIIEQVPDVGTVLVQLSGGGLAAGIAAAIRAQKPSVRIIGVSTARGAAMKASLEAGRPVDVEELPTLADSLGGGIGLDNRLTFHMCRDLLDDVVVLAESEIAAGIRHLYSVEREIAEGAGSVCVASLLARKAVLHGPVVALVSGRNIDMDVHRRIVSGEWTEFERLDAAAGRAA